MTDELAELRQANPVRTDELEPLVAMTWRQAVHLLEHDDAQRRGLRPVGGRHSKTATRSGYVVVTVAAAVAALVGFLALAPDSTVVDDSRDLTPAAEGGPTTPLVVPETSVLDDSDAIEGTATSSTETTSTTAQPTNAETGDGVTTTGGTTPTITGPFNHAVDLLAVHFDFSHRDDGLAAIATREIADQLQLKPHVVAGTQSIESDEFFHEYAGIMTAAWGNGWADATASRPAAVDEAAQRWQSTIDAGGRVWVAEGGTSDFTADVLRVLAQQRPELDTGRTVIVVQHAKRNEAETEADNLAYVMDNADFIRIDDGNAINRTANLNQQSDVFEATALAGSNRDRWSVGFEYLSPADLDFSDTVAVLHILGIGTDQVADPDSFAAYFMD